MEKLKMWKKKAKNGGGEWASAFSGDSKVTAELRKLTNSPGWVAATQKILSSGKTHGSSGSSTPSNVSGKSKRGRKKKEKNKKEEKKKFKMVLEKDDDYEIDYVSPEEDENTEDSESELKPLSEVSDDELSLEEEDEDMSSIDGSIEYEDEYSDFEIDEDAPHLDLPESSQDLLIPNNLVLPALEVYETLRHFRSLLRLSPMLFEDFSAALVDEDTNILMTECYTSVLKSIVREEDAAGTQFGPPDQKDSRDSALSFLDNITWPEVVRAYLDSTREHDAVLEIVSNPKFPRVGAEEKILVLKTLTDTYLASNKIRDKLMTDGVIQYDDHCRACHKLGDLLCCETCPAVYHLACCDPPLTEVPDDEWQCEICVAHKLNGVYNCELKKEFKGQYLRHDSLGADRHGRTYWFIARRLIVEGAGQVWYYSTKEQFDLVRSRLCPDKYEIVLHEALKQLEDDFQKFSQITYDITEGSLPDDDTIMYLQSLKDRIKREEDEKREKERMKAAEEKKKREEEEKKEKIEETESQKTTEFKDDICPDKPDILESDNIAKTAQKTEIDSSNTENASKSLEETTDKSLEDKTPKALITPCAPPAVVSMPTPLSSLSGNLSKENVKVIDAPVKIQSPVIPKAVVAPAGPGLGKSIQVIKLATPNNPLKGGLGSLGSQLKTLFVLNKDGTKTQITLGPTGKIAPRTPGQQSTAGRQILVLNSAKVALPKVTSDLKRTDGNMSATKTVISQNQISSINPPRSNTTTQSMHTVPTPAPQPVKQLTHEEEAALHFKLGEDKGFRQYVNHYSENTLALNKYQHKEERDRERYLSYKFSLSDAGEFKWMGETLGSESVMLETLRNTLLHLEHQIPLCFMHTKWARYRNAWGKIVLSCNTPQAFAAALGILEMATRVVVKRSIWKNSHGLPRLKRVTTSEKEDWEKKRKHRTRAEEEEANRNAIWCKYPFPIKCTLVWKVRGEEYRMTGYGGWMWVSNTRCSRISPPKSKPYTIIHVDPKEENDATKPRSTESSPLKRPVLPGLSDFESDSEKSSSTTSTATTKSADLTEERGIFDSLVQDASDQPKSGPVLPSSPIPVTPNSESLPNDVVKSEPMETEITASLSMKEACDEIIESNDVINISENLLKRTPLYNKKWSASKVDILLGWRMVQSKEIHSTQTISANNSKADPLQDKMKAENLPPKEANADKTNNKTAISTTGDKTMNKRVAMETGDSITVSNDSLKRKVESNLEISKPVVKPICNGVESMETDQINPEKRPVEKSLSNDVKSDFSVIKSDSCQVDETEVDISDSSIASDVDICEDNRSTEQKGVDKTRDVAMTDNVAKMVENVAKDEKSEKVDAKKNVFSEGEKSVENASEDAKPEFAEAVDEKRVENAEKEAKPEKVEVKKIVFSDGEMSVENAEKDEKQEKLEPKKTDFSEDEKLIENDDIDKSASGAMTIDNDVDVVSTPTISDTVNNTVISGDNLSVRLVKLPDIEQNATVLTSSDSASFSDIVTETTKTTISDGENSVTIVKTCTTAVTKLTTVTTTVCSTSDSVISNAASEFVSDRPEVVVTLPRIEFKQGKATVASVQTRIRVSRMSKARRIFYKRSADGPVLETQKVWKLRRFRKTSATLKKEKAMKLPLPWKFCVGKQKAKSIFRLPSPVVRKLAVTGGQWAYRAGFTFGAKWFSGLEQFWLYPCPRPTFSLTWRYKLQNVTNYASVAFLLRIFWHSIKWDKMTLKPQTDDVVHTVTTDEEIITTELLKRKDNMATGLHSDYFIRKIIMPILDPEEEALRAIKPAAGYTPSRKGLRNRRSLTLNNRPKKDSEPRVQTIWVPEEQVELWQIRQFDMMLKQQSKLTQHVKVPSGQTGSILHSGANTFIATPSGGILPTLQNLKTPKSEHDSLGSGFSILKLPLNQNAQMLQKSFSTTSTAQAFLGSKTVIGRPPVQKFIVQSPGQQFSAYKPGDRSTAVIRSTASSGTQYIVQGGKLVKPFLIKAGSQMATSVSQVASRFGEQAFKYSSTPVPTPVKTAPPKVQPSISQTQIKLSSSQLSQLLKAGSAAPVRVTVSLGNGRTGTGQIQLIPPGSQVTPTSGQQLMQAKVGGDVRRFLFTLMSEAAPATAPVPATKPSTPSGASSTPANEHSLRAASLSQRLQQIQRQQLLGKSLSTDMKRMMTDKDPLWGSKPLLPDRAPLASPVLSRSSMPTPDSDKPRRRPLSKLQREEGQRQTVVAQVMKSLLDRIDKREELEVRKKKKEEAMMRQRERQEQIKVHSRQTQFLHKHRDILKQEILKRKAIVEKYLTQVVKNELQEDQRRRRGGHYAAAAKKARKSHGNAGVVNGISNKKLPAKKQAVKRQREPSPVPEYKKQKMINTSQAKGKEDELYCTCRTPYDATRFYIGCDLCLNWFHGSCVGIPESRAKHMSEWICYECQKAKEEPAQELYCVCRTPYDDSKFYIGCDICQDWYHGSCVGVSEKDAEDIDYYACPKCKKQSQGENAMMKENKLTRKDIAELTKVINALRAHKMSWPFLQPVSKLEVPNYHKVIKKPMDLGTILQKMPSYTMLSDVMGDVSLIFDNCRMFNGADSALAKCAEILESLFVGKMRQYRQNRK